MDYISMEYVYVSIFCTTYFVLLNDKYYVNYSKNIIIKFKNSKMQKYKLLTLKFFFIFYINIE